MGQARIECLPEYQLIEVAAHRPFKPVRPTDATAGVTQSGGFSGPTELTLNRSQNGPSVILEAC